MFVTLLNDKECVEAAASNLGKFWVHVSAPSPLDGVNPAHKIVAEHLDVVVEALGVRNAKLYSMFCYQILSHFHQPVPQILLRVLAKQLLGLSARG